VVAAVAAGCGPSSKGGAGTGGSVAGTGGAGTGGAGTGGAGMGGAGMGGAGTGGAGTGGAGMGGSVDAGLPDDAGLPGDAGAQLGPLVPLPLREPGDAGVFNHSAETTIAARGGTVVVAYISLGFEQAGSFQSADVIRGGSLAVSHDRGATFGPAMPMAGVEPTDPVVRVSREGTFFAASWDWSTSGTTAVGALQRSSDGDRWETVAGDIPTGDKQWFAVDDTGRRIFWGGMTSYQLFGFDGQTLGTTTAGAEQMTNAIIVDGAALFTTLGYGLVRWDGNTAPTMRTTPLPGQPTAPGAFIATTSTGLGVTAGGRVWLLRTDFSAATPRIVLRVWDGTVNGEGDDVPVSAPGAAAFLPAGAVDGDGRLHAAFYQDGALVWTRSRTANLGDGFVPVTVVDPDACPAGGWTPNLDDPDGGRRLREYIDVALDGPRLHLTWTHAPSAPSRVYTTTIRL
jgi:hypothetical protein